MRLLPPDSKILQEVFVSHDLMNNDVLEPDRQDYLLILGLIEPNICCAIEGTPRIKPGSIIEP